LVASKPSDALGPLHFFGRRLVEQRADGALAGVEDWAFPVKAERALNGLFRLGRVIDPLEVEGQGQVFADGLLALTRALVGRGELDVNLNQTGREVGCPLPVADRLVEVALGDVDVGDFDVLLRRLAQPSMRSRTSALFSSGDRIVRGELVGAV
jgi:hypothetical protein